MDDFLPLFPLRLVVYPGEELNLHIFEPRYKQLIRECDENGITFGIPTFLEDKVMNVGTEIELLSITKRHENGEMDIKTRGIGIFKMKEFYPNVNDKLYSGADIERLSLVESGEDELYDKILIQLEELYTVLNIEQVHPKNREKFSCYEIGHHLGMSLDQEYELLRLQTEIERQHFILEHIFKMIPIVKNIEAMKAKVQMNGHFKKILPPDFKEGFE